MTALAITFYAIASIAIAAIAICFYLLDQRTRLRREKARLLRIVARTKRLRIRALRERNECHALHTVREAAVIRHARGLYEENNQLRAQLVAYSEPPRFGVVRIGNG